jgi:hypothetical protein
VVNILFWPRDQKGNYLPSENPEAKPKSVSEKEAFFIRRRKFGFPDWRIEEFYSGG